MYENKQEIKLQIKNQINILFLDKIVSQPLIGVDKKNE